MDNNNKKDVVKLGGRKFKRVKNGLDESQLASFIDELISERDKLAKSQAHIASLNRLAEQTIAEADKLADQIKTEATEQAKAESDAIIDKAKEQAQQIAEEKESEAVEIANEKAKAIQSEAEKQAALLIDDERKRIQDKLSNFVNQQFSHLLEELESLKQQASAAQADFNNKLSQPGKESSAVTAESEEESNTTTMEESKVLDESPEAIRDENQTDKILEPFNLLNIEDHAELGEPQLEVEILPPVDLTKLMKIVAYLDQLPEIVNTEIIPRTDAPSIAVFWSEPIDFVDVIGAIPEVAYLEEVTNDEDVTNGEPRKVRISLSENANSQEKK